MYDEHMREQIIEVNSSKSITEALQEAAQYQGRVVLVLERGTYYEKVTVDRPEITLRGVSTFDTCITFDDAALTRINGNPMGTFATASVTVKAPCFRAENLTFANGFDYPAHSGAVKDNPGKVKGLQAVAFRTTESADKTELSGCSFIGYQDTLLLDAGYHHLEGCTIEGNIDFIFGAGTALFEGCTILSNGSGYVCAPSTKSDRPGFLFHRCNFMKKQGVEKSSVYLGRPWHPGADPFLVSYAGLLECHLEDHIKEEGWTWMHAFPPSGGEQIFTVEQSHFFESESSGPGSSPLRNTVSLQVGFDELKRFLELDYVSECI